MTKRLFAAASAAAFDPAKTYEIEVTRPVRHAGLTLRPANNPYAVKGAAAAALYAALRPDRIMELDD